MVLLGPNGSGKSTLLKTLSRTLPPLAGDIELMGRPLAQYSHRDLAQRLGFVPQEEHVPFPFTVRELVVMGRLPHSGGLFDTVEDHRVATRCMETTDCLHLEHKPLQKLSGGEKQRALLARALAQDAPVLLMDEPNAHLDFAHQALAVEIVRRLAAEGRSILIALHDLNLASILGDQAVVLAPARGGHADPATRVARQGPMQEVLRSGAIEDAFGIPFERVEGNAGIIRMLPRFEKA